MSALALGLRIQCTLVKEANNRRRDSTVSVRSTVRQQTCCPRQDGDAEGRAGEKRLGMEILADALALCASVDSACGLQGGTVFVQAGDKLKEKLEEVSVEKHDKCKCFLTGALHVTTEELTSNPK